MVLYPRDSPEDREIRTCHEKPVGFTYMAFWTSHATIRWCARNLMAQAPPDSYYPSTKEGKRSFPSGNGRTCLRGNNTRIHSPRTNDVGFESHVLAPPFRYRVSGMTCRSSRSHCSQCSRGCLPMLVGMSVDLLASRLVQAPQTTLNVYHWNILQPPRSS
jgi:hypothetical protein